MMNKITINSLIIFLILTFLVSFDANSQDFGKTSWTESVSATEKDGYKPPLTKGEEQVRRKAKRLSLTLKDIQVLNLSQKGKELTFKQKLRLPFAKRKKRKLEKLQNKAESLAKSDTPGYMKPDDKNVLTIDEREILEKAENDTVELTKKEMRIYKKALKKQEKQEKHKSKYTPNPLSSDEEALLTKKSKMPDSLSKEEKKLLKDIKKKEKYNKKVDERIYQYRLDSAYATGMPMPVKEKKINLPKIRIVKKANRPSSYMKKKMKLQKKYIDPPRKFVRITKKKSEDKKLTQSDQRYLAKYRKKKKTNEWIYKNKMNKLNKKYFLKNQMRVTRKQMKKAEKKSKKRDKKRQNYLRKTNFLNLFKKKQ